MLKNSPWNMTFRLFLADSGNIETIISQLLTQSSIQYRIFWKQINHLTNIPTFIKKFRLIMFLGCFVICFLGIYAIKRLVTSTLWRFPRTDWGWILNLKRLSIDTIKPTNFGNLFFDLELRNWKIFWPRIAQFLWLCIDEFWWADRKLVKNPSKNAKIEKIPKTW